MHVGGVLPQPVGGVGEQSQGAADLLVASPPVTESVGGRLVPSAPAPSSEPSRSSASGLAASSAIRSSTRDSSSAVTTSSSSSKRCRISISVERFDQTAPFAIRPVVEPVADLVVLVAGLELRQRRRHQALRGTDGTALERPPRSHSWGSTRSCSYAVGPPAPGAASGRHVAVHDGRYSLASARRLRYNYRVTRSDERRSAHGEAECCTGPCAARLVARGRRARRRRSGSPCRRIGWIPDAVSSSLEPGEAPRTSRRPTTPERRWVGRGTAGEASDHRVRPFPGSASTTDFDAGRGRVPADPDGLMPTRPTLPAAVPRAIRPAPGGPTCDVGPRWTGLSRPRLSLLKSRPLKPHAGVRLMCLPLRHHP